MPGEIGEIFQSLGEIEKPQVDIYFLLEISLFNLTSRKIRLVWIKFLRGISYPDRKYRVEIYKI